MQPQWYYKLVGQLVGLINPLYSQTTNHNTLSSGDAELQQQVTLRPGTDYCNQIQLAAQPTQTYDSMVQCFNMVSLNPYRKQQTLDNLLDILPFYVFNELAKDPRGTPAGEAYNLTQVDLKAKLLEFKTLDFDSEFEFHNQLSKLFRTPMDGHLAYIPQCYTMFKFYLPFSLQLTSSDPSPSRSGDIRYNTYRQQLTLLPATMYQGEIFSYAQSITKLNLMNYVGWTVVMIDGSPAIEKLVEMSETNIGIVKDHSARLNQMLVSPTVYNGLPNLVWGGFASPSNLPSQGWVNLTISNPIRPSEVIDIKIPYVTRFNPALVNLESGDEFFRSRCLNYDSDDGSQLLDSTLGPTPLLIPHPATHGAVGIEEQDEDDGYDDGMIRYDNIDRELNINSMLPLNTNNNDTSPQNLYGFLAPTSHLNTITSNRWLSTYLLSDNRTGVLVYPTNKATKVVELNEFLLSFHNALTQLVNKLNTTTVILDLSHNTGGAICASLGLLNYLIPDKALRPNYYTMMNHHNVARNLANEAEAVDPNYRVWGPFSWSDPSTGTSYTDSSWMNPVVSKLSMNQQKLLTRPIIDRCPTSPLADLVSPLPLKQLQIVTNGLCLSSCATLLDGLIRTDQVLSHFTDGRPPSPLRMDSALPSPHNMQGGQLYTHDKLKADLSRFNSQPNKLARFPTRTTFGFTLRQLVHQNESIPMEYQRAESANQMFYTPRTLTLKSTRPLDYFWNKVANLPNLAR